MRLVGSPPCRLHDRMPVILPDKAAEDLWLAGEGGMDLK